VTNMFSFFQAPPSIVFGYGSIEVLNSEIARLGRSKVLVVTDRGIVEAGLIEKLTGLLDKGKFQYEIYYKVTPDPPVEDVEDCLFVIREGKFDLIIGVGGGSAIDVAKYSAALFNHGGSPRDYFGVDKLNYQGLPKIIIPTTSGTGSEVTKAVVFTDDNRTTKKACWSPFVIADSVIIDPQMTMTMPTTVTVDTGMDALVHAIEAHVSLKASIYTDMFALNAVKLIGKSLRRAYTNGSNLQARMDMCLASAFAGLAFSNAGLGAVHALAYPLDLDFHLTHGRSVAVLLPYILEFNLMSSYHKYSQLAEALEEKVTAISNDKAARKLIQAVVKLAGDCNISLNLRDYGIKREEVENLGRKAYRIGQRLLNTNPRRLTEEDSIKLYIKAYGV
jgi:alcohol dehydrogenase class IV